MKEDYLITEWFSPSEPIPSQWGTLEASVWAVKESMRINRGGKLITAVIYNTLEHTIAIADGSRWEANDKERLWRINNE